MTDDTLWLRIANTDMRQTAQTVMTCLNTIQDKPQDVQIMATAVLFLCLSNRFRVRPPDVLSAADNLVRKSGGYSEATFEGVKAYMKNELED